MHSCCDDRKSQHQRTEHGLRCGPGHDAVGMGTGLAVAHALSQTLAARLVSRLTDVRKSGLLWWLRPGCKAQVAIEYLVNGASVVPLMIHTVAIYTQHAVPLCATRTMECAGYTGPEMTAPSVEEMNRFIVQHVLSTTLGEIKLENGTPGIALLCDSTNLHINPSSKISVGGPQGAAAH